MSRSDPTRPASATPDQGPVSFFTADHRACDELWAAVETTIDARDAAAAAAAIGAFDAAVRRHLDMEEQVLFPAFESTTGITRGPTMVMRMEHEQMRGVLDQIARAAAGRDFDAVLDHGDTLLMLTQQHNAKEEGMLYPMCEAHLAAGWPEIAARLARY